MWPDVTQICLMRGRVKVLGVTHGFIQVANDTNRSLLKGRTFASSNTPNAETTYTSTKYRVFTRSVRTVGTPDGFMQ